MSPVRNFNFPKDTVPQKALYRDRNMRVYPHRTRIYPSERQTQDTGRRSCAHVGLRPHLIRRIFHDRYFDRMPDDSGRRLGHPEGQIRPDGLVCQRRVHAALRHIFRHGHVHAQEGAADGQRLSERHRIHPLHVLEPSGGPGLPHHDDGGLCVLHDAHRRE